MRMSVAIAVAMLIASGATAAPTVIERPGTIVHGPADASFPERVGEFRRQNAHQYDSDGRDISATYNLARPEGRLVLSVYIYPAPGVSGRGSTADAARAELCRQSFEGISRAIEAQHQDVATIERGPAPAVKGVGPALSHRAVFRMRTKFDGSEQDVRSEADLYCYVDGDWLVKYRATSHGRFDAGPEVEAFIRSGPWPGRPAPPAPGASAAR
jgi:hypothetical protein